MVAWTSLAVHFLIVIEEVRVDFVKEPLLFRDCLLDGHESRAWDPVDKGTSWPLVREWQVEELQHLEERAETIDEPVLVVFRDAAL